MKRLSLVLFLATIAIFACQEQAAAQCVGHSQLSLFGSWQIYLSRDNASGFMWTRIPLIIGNTGTIQSGTTAKDSAGAKFTVTSGSLLLNINNCKVAGTIFLRPAGTVTTIQIDVNHATLSLDDQSIMGVGYYAGKPFKFTGVKVNTL